LFYFSPAWCSKGEVGINFIRNVNQFEIRNIVFVILSIDWCIWKEDGMAVGCTVTFRL